MEKITIYTNETCAYCKQVKNKFKEKKIKFIEKEVKKWKKEYQQIVNLTSVATTPIVEYKNEYFIGGRDYRNPDQLIDILKVFENSKYDDSKIIIERLKTLNYNMATAFNALDQVLKLIETKIKI